MKIIVLLPGKIKPKALASVQEEYVRRLKPFGVELVEYRDEKIGSRAPDQVKEAEVGRIFRLLKEGDYLVACDERGETIATQMMADVIRASRHGDPPLIGKHRIVVVIGGALGLADSCRKKADAIWSLSSLTMAGGIARIVLLEGLYRAFTIVEGHPYHNE